MEFLKKHLWAIAILVTALIDLALAFVVVTAEQKAAVLAFGVAVAGILVRMGQNQEPPNSGGGAASQTKRMGLTSMAVAFIAGLLLLPIASACTPAARAKVLPVLSAVDAVGVTVANALGWCQDHGVDETTLSRARRAAEHRDYGEAVAIARHLLDVSAKAGVDVPTELVASLTLAQQILDVQGLQAGMRALDGRNADGELKDGGS